MIGTTVKAKGRKTLRIVGAVDGAWVGVPAAEHGSPVKLTADEMIAYGLTPPGVTDPEAALRSADVERTVEVNSAYFTANAKRGSRKVKDQPGFTPEQQFEAAAAEGKPAAGVAARILADPVKLTAVDTGEVPIHADVARELERLRADA